MTGTASQLRPEQVKAMMDTGEAYLIDVREPAEFAAAHIAGAELLPLSRFDPAAVQPPTGKQLVIQCRSGVRCGMASEALRSAGFEGPIARMTGGLVAWLEAGLPVVRPGRP
jgi:rhodanese-related sulfurtransferase